jgi:thymidylate synthase (FAD)
MTKIADIDFEKDKNYIKYLDHGFVGLVDTMGSDEAIVQAARVSYGDGTKGTRNDRALIRYLVKHRHTSPLEMCEVKFHLKMPIFVMRQHVRHRTANLNEYSGRYSIMSDEFYVPDKANLKPQSAINKQGRDGTLIPLEETMCYNTIKRIGQENYNDYLSLLGENPNDNYNIDSKLRQGLSRELARAVLPLNNYTELYWKIDLNNFFHYVKLRADYHAQWEIQELARAMYSLIVDKFPLACEAYEDYIENATTVSRMEKDLIKRIMSNKRWLDVQEDYRTDELLAENYGMSKRELTEFIDKWKP